MKTPFKFLAVVAVSAFPFSVPSLHAQDAPPPPDAQGDQGGPVDEGDQGDQGASFQQFYDQLGNQGTWVQTDDYGYVFQPNVSDPNWAPYTDGHWVYTDEGWAWVSDEPWGWATYHYGRWANIDGTGWVWVPGYRWAPAWVSWRYGGGYCGWAPLPPETFVGAEYGGPGVAVGVGFHFGGDVDVNFGIGPGCYNFLSVGDMGYPNYRGRFIDRSRNYTVINNTTNITNINVNKTVNNYNGGATGNFRGVAVGGPPINEVNAHAHTRVSTVQLAAQNQAGRSTLQGNTLAVYAPRFNPASVHQARPTGVAQTIAHPTFNRGTSINQPLAVTANVRPHAPTATAIQAAQAAQLHAPARAKVATENTPVRTHLSAPLTSMQPVAQIHRTPNAATNPGANNFHGQATVNPNSEHSAAAAPFTGEAPATQHTAATPGTTYHPQTEVKPTQTFHPQSEGNPEVTHHTQSEGSPEVKHHTESEGSAPSTFHPQTEVKPTETFHPQSQGAPAQSYHPQSQGGGGGQVHTQAAPANHSAPSGGGGKPSSGGGGKPAPADKNAQGK